MSILLIDQVHSLGLIIPPILSGDNNKYSDINNLLNCISYPTVKDDIIVLTIDSGDKLPSQVLNLNIFDSENNKIRFKGDISQDMTIIFTNLNNPSLINGINDVQDMRSNILNRFLPLARADRKQERVNELMSSDSGKSLIYICFDNIYKDKSWSFHPQDRDVGIEVNIKNMTAMQQPDYSIYSLYFNKLNSDEENKKIRGKGSEDVNDNKYSQIPNRLFTKDDFDTNIKLLESKLNDVIENLKNSELILENLMQQEYKLRDVNEAIYSGYTKISCIMLVLIGIAGIVQMVYFRCYLKKRKVL